MSHHQPSPSSLFTLPPEIITEIAFELSALQPLGPPSVLSPFRSTCRTIRRLLSPAHNSGLWARIFRHKFDSTAVQRRAMAPTTTQYFDQLVRYCQAMQVLRVADRYSGYGVEIWDPLPDMGLEEALQTALIMMYEDDGRNSRQLLEWANIWPLLNTLVGTRTYDGSGSNHGWAQENRLNACALWLMWMLASEETIKKLSDDERNQLSTTLLPFVLFPYRYPVAEAPPNFFHLPLDSAAAPAQAPTTIQTAHGPYPVFPPPRITHEVHYSSMPDITIPLMALPAKLLFFALSEATSVPIPSFLARTRQEWLARGITDILPTRDALEEFNWGWYARLPLGPGRGLFHRALDKDPSPRANAWRWEWGNGDQDFPDALFDGVTNVLPPPAARDEVGNPRWRGKAPHTAAAHESSTSSLVSKSRLWDSDWWRFRLCGDPTRPPTRVPYGRVYEPGCMDGFWQGRMVTLGQSELEALLGNPTRPQDLTQDSLGVMFHFVFARFREAHAIVGVDHGDELGVVSRTEGGGEGSGEENQDNMNNAWFAGRSGSTTFSLRHEATRDVVDIAVENGAGQIKRASFPCWRQRGRPVLGLGNDALYEDERGDMEMAWSGHDHDELGCDECLGRRSIQRQLDREQADEDARVGSYRPDSSEGPTSSGPDGGGDETDGSPQTNEASVASNDNDASFDEWDPYYASDIDSEGNLQPPLPSAHEREKLAKGKCTGIKDIFLVGETPQRHGDAFNHFVYYGRVRMWDGLIAILRKPKRAEDSHLGTVLFYGHLIGGENFVGNWRITSVDPGLPAWEGAFVMSRRRD